MDRKSLINSLVSNPQELLKKKPFTRGLKVYTFNETNATAEVNTMITPRLPQFSYEVVTQCDYDKELNIASHKIHYDDNIPSITMKLRGKDAGYINIQDSRIALPYQKGIKNKQVLHLCGNPTEFTMMNTKPTEKQLQNFITFKQFYSLRNQDGMRTKLIDAQKSYGDAAELYYFDYEGKIKSRLLSYPNYILCPLNDNNGDRLIESVYYRDDDGYERIDSYDDTYSYHFIKDITSNANEEANEWRLESKKVHGFPEIPLVSHRGKVAWEDAQPIIEVYEILYNIFTVIMKRYGNGILYIKGQFSEKVKRIAGSIILADRSMDGNGSADFKAPPSPQGMFDMLKKLRDEIQTASGTTFLLPEDIKMSGDISGIALQLTKSGDNETALLGAMEWQNAIDKRTRLFKYGLSVELTRNGINPTAITEFEEMHISSKLKIWMPKSNSEVVQILSTCVAQGITSKKTARERVEALGINSPDEEQRCNKEAEDLVKLEQAQKTETIDVVETNKSNNNNNTKEKEESNE